MNEELSDIMDRLEQAELGDEQAKVMDDLVAFIVGKLPEMPRGFDD